MNDIKDAMRQYFPRLISRYKSVGEEYPIIAVPDGTNNILLLSQINNSDWFYWLPIEKNTKTDFSEIEIKYGHTLHSEIKDYYNQYWFYILNGNVYIDEQMGTDMIQLERVVPGYEIHDLDAHIERYYCGGNINNFRMIPVGFVQNVFVVVDNLTGEVFVDDRLEFGKFRKIADGLAELINKLEP